MLPLTDATGIRGTLPQADFRPYREQRWRRHCAHMAKHHRSLGSRHKDAAWLRELEKQQQRQAEIAETRRKELERKERAEAALAAELNRAI